MFPATSNQQICFCLLMLALFTGAQGYFAFPRQGRAMSFYFPRMGRSGEGVAAQGSQCCERGVKTVFSGIRGSFEICPRDQPCCEGLEERTKLYMDLVITDCAQSSSLEKIRQIMTNE